MNFGVKSKAEDRTLAPDPNFSGFAAIKQRETERTFHRSIAA